MFPPALPLMHVAGQVDNGEKGLMGEGSEGGWMRGIMGEEGKLG